MSKQLKASLLLTIAAFIWGSTFVAQTIGAGYVGPLTFLASRSYLGAFALLPLSLRNKKDINWHNISSGIIVGIFLTFASLSQQAGIGYTDSTAKASFITALYIIFVPLIESLRAKRFDLKLWFCVIISTIGLAFLCNLTSLSLSLGDSLLFLCAILYSCHILVINKFAPTTNGIIISNTQFITCAIISTILMLFFEPLDIAAVQSAIAPICYAGFLSSGIAYTLQIIAQKDLDPTIASLIMSLESVFGALGGLVVLHQVLSDKELLGCVLMFAAIIIAQLEPKK